MAKLNPLTLKTKAGLTLTLRSPEPQDASELLSTVREIFRTSPYLLTEESEFTVTPEQEADLLKGALEHPDQLWIVPIVEGKIVGMLNFLPGKRRRISHQGNLGVSLVERFRGQGVGRALMESLIEWAAGHPTLETLRLEVLSGNAGAIRLYQSLGFHEEGRQRNGVKFPDGSYHDTILMAKAVK